MEPYVPVVVVVLALSIVYNQSLSTVYIHICPQGQIGDMKG